MNDISADRRLELIRSVREEQARNYMTMQRRESVLYGSNLSMPAQSMDRSVAPINAGLKLRIAIALILFLGFLILDKNHYTFLSLDSSDVITAISEEVNSFDFMEDIPYTLLSK